QKKMSVGKIPVEFEHLPKLVDGAVEPAFGYKGPGGSDSRNASEGRRFKRLGTLPLALGLGGPAFQTQVKAISKTGYGKVRVRLACLPNFLRTSTPLPPDQMAERQGHVRLGQLAVP